MTEEMDPLAPQRERERVHLAVVLGRAILDRLTAMGMAYYYKRHEKDWMETRVQRIRFSDVFVGPHAIFYRVDVRTLPRYVKAMDLVKEEVAHDLSLTVHRRVTVEENVRSGLWIVVHLRDDSGLPRMYPFQRLLAETKPSARLPFPIGRTASGPLVLDLSDNATPHWLIGGSTGMGKSTFLRAALAYLLKFARVPVEVKIVDLKKVDFAEWGRIPSVDVVTELDDAMDLIRWAAEEMERRLNMMKGRARDIVAWNKGRKNPIPWIVIVIDELATLTLDDGFKKEALTLLALIAQKARAPGIHLVAATQRPSVDVIPGIIKANFQARIAFSTATEVDSRVIIDTGEAARLFIPGRLVARYSDQTVFAQAPYIDDGDLEEVIRDLQAKSEHTPLHVDQEAVRIAVEQLGGRLDVALIYEALGGQVSLRDVQAAVRRLAYAGQVEYRGTKYRVLRRPYRLQRLSLDGADEEGAGAGAREDEEAAAIAEAAEEIDLDILNPPL
jgi:DNA segregation ATPase FtsK/SpoIIIE-like protein